jgi:hypothetical protein
MTTLNLRALIRQLVLTCIGLALVAAMPTAAVARLTWGPVGTLTLLGLALAGTGCLLAAVPARRPGGVR